MLALAFWAGGAGADGASFFEPFDALDGDRWFVSDGWANGPHQSCLWHRDRVAVRDGALVLSLTDDAEGDRALSCAEIQSEDRFHYGTFEARVKVPYAHGMNVNFFTFIGPPQDRPHNEIDFEFLARDAPVLQTNFHLRDDNRNEELHPMEDDGAFLTLSVIWEADRLRWYVDGELIRTEADGDLPDEPQKIYLSLWSTDTLTDWMGTFRAEDAPQHMEVDWVAYTAPGEGCAFEASILCAQGVEVPN
ncbi:family 16 glycosylhydrolase [Aestuariibius sp. 2305UL40-4]|uniref:family 16 glycosylhydrolase n=1 Tax=Aestuariibius violaceus TaxID=3234132 RepID=UPI00345F03A3